MAENIAVNSLKFIKSVFTSRMQTLILGLSGALNGGAAYSYIASLGYFTPAGGIVAGLVGGSGVAARDIFYRKEYGEDIPLKAIATYVLFGIIALFMGYIFVYYFVKLPTYHGDFILPAEYGTIYDFFRATMGLPDIFAAILGSISSSAIPINLPKIRNLIKSYSASK